MSEKRRDGKKRDDKRRDTKGRVLRNGESQEKDGRYTYKYTDAFGERKTVRSWRLVNTDLTPPGKHASRALREMEAEIQAELAKGIGNNNITVLELVDKYLATMQGVRHNTAANYKTVRNTLSKEVFGYYKIKRVKTSDAKLFLIKLQKEDGKGYSSIHTIRGVLRPAFQMAVDDDLLLKNPFEFPLLGVIVNDSVRREAIAPEQERLFLSFVQSDRYFSKYYDGIYILLNTGLRISEFCGLTFSDIDLEKEEISITHQLQRKRTGEYVVEETKTTAGTRVIPMDIGVADAFRRVLANRKHPKAEPMIDGYTGFLFLDKNDMPTIGLHWDHYFKHICDKYNKIYRVQLPRITPHVCRHTYCSKKARQGMNPKTLQYIMGHSDICVTYNTYTHLGLAEAKEEMDKIARETADERYEAWRNRRKRAIGD